MMTKTKNCFLIYSGSNILGGENMQDYKSFEIKKDEIVPLAEKMKKDARRLIMIEGFVDKEGKNVVSYQYEIGNCIESYTIAGQESLPTISHIYDLAAAWPEEELFELMGMKFDGLSMRGRLFMADNMLDGQGHILVTALKDLREKAIGEKEE